MHKRIISLIFSLLIMILFTIPVFAEQSQSESSDQYNITMNDDTTGATEYSKTMDELDELLKQKYSNTSSSNFVNPPWDELPEEYLPNDNDYFIGNFKFNKTTSTITGYSKDGSKDVIIPDSLDGVTVVSIGFEAFAGSQLTSVVIPNSVTSIGDYAFESNKLTSVTIPNSIVSIGSYAFSNNQLKSVIIPNSVNFIGDGAFISNNLTSLTMSDQIFSIGKNVFTQNPNLAKINLKRKSIIL